MLYALCPVLFAVACIMLFFVLCRTGTWAVCWSPSNEHQLFTGDASGEVRLWDIRRSGTRALLDMAVTQKPKPRPGVTPAAAAGAGASGRAANGHDGSNSRRSSGVKRKASAAAAAAAAEGGGGAEEDTYDDPRFGVGVRHRGRATKPMAHEGPVTCEGLVLTWQLHILHVVR